MFLSASTDDHPLTVGVGAHSNARLHDTKDDLHVKACRNCAGQTGTC